MEFTIKLHDPMTGERSTRTVYDVPTVEAALRSVRSDIGQGSGFRLVSIVRPIVLADNEG